MLADDERHKGKHRVDGDTGDGSLCLAEQERDHEGGENGRGGEKPDEIDPGSDRRWACQQIDCGVLEPVGASAVGDDQGQSGCCSQAHQCGDLELGPRHEGKLRHWPRRTAAAANGTPTRRFALCDASGIVVMAFGSRTWDATACACAAPGGDHKGGCGRGASSARRCVLPARPNGRHLDGARPGRNENGVQGDGRHEAIPARPIARCGATVGMKYSQRTPRSGRERRGGCDAAAGEFPVPVIRMT